MAARGSYKYLTLEAKVEIIKKIKCDRSKVKDAEEYGIKKGYLFEKWCIYSEIMEKSFSKEEGRKRMRATAHEDLEEALLLWKNDTWTRNISSSVSILAINTK